MKMIKDRKIIVLAVILVVFSIGYFVIVNQISYAFTQGFDMKEVYEHTLETIKTAAEHFANNKDDLFNDDNIVYIKVQDLVDNNLLASDTEGNIISPLNNEPLNSKIIKLKKEKNKIVVEVDA